MLAITLVFSVMFFLMSIVVGTLVGWVLNEYLNSSKQYNVHPEMFDANGNLIPDQVIAFRFDDSDDDNFEEEEIKD